MEMNKMATKKARARARRETRVEKIKYKSWQKPQAIATVSSSSACRRKFSETKIETLWASSRYRTFNTRMSEIAALVAVVGSWFGGLATRVLGLVLSSVCKPVLSNICPPGLLDMFDHVAMRSTC